MLHLTQSLPPQILLGSDAVALAAAARLTGGIWFRAQQDALRHDGPRITGWADMTGAVVAMTNAPNTGNSRFDEGDPPAMVFAAGLPCGFVLDGVSTAVSAFSAAVLYSSPEGEARTLCSLSTGQSNNLIFLGETEDRLLAKDRGDAVSLELPLSGDRRAGRLAILSFNRGELRIEAAEKTARATGRVTGLDQPADFFIGCRSNRPGLFKTLGASRIHDVLFWPDRALLGSDDPADVDALAALHRYHRWSRWPIGAGV